MIHESDYSREAREDRRNVDTPEPDFDVDVELTAVRRVNGTWNMRAEVYVEINETNERFSPGAAVKVGEPVFFFNLPESRLPPEPTMPDDARADDYDYEEDFPSLFGDHPELSYWLPLSRLMGGGLPHHGRGDPELTFTTEDRHRMLVWWDQHAEEVESRSTPQPSDEEIARLLKRRGFRAVQCGYNADWSVQAWYLGPMPGMKDKGANRTDGGIYLLDAETQDKYNTNLFVLVRQYFGVDREWGDELHSGPLDEMIAEAVEILR